MIYLPKRIFDRILKLIILLILGTSILGVFYYQMLLNQYASLEQEVAWALDREKYLLSGGWEQELDETKQEYLQLINQLARFEKSVPLLSQLDFLSRESGVAIEVIKPESEVTAKNILELSAKGSWNNSITFWRLLEELSPFLAIDYISIQALDHDYVSLYIRVSYGAIEEVNP